MVDINLFFPLLVHFSFFLLSTSFLCSSSRVFSSLPVSPMYSAPQFLHGIWYTSSPCSSSSTLSLGCTNKRLRVVWGRIVVATPYFFSTRCTLSEINLSKYKLSGNQNKILAKGLNYAVTPEKIPTEEFVVAAEQATWSLATTRTKRQTSCRHHGSPEVGKSSKTKYNQTGENSFKRATEREVHHHTPCGQGKRHSHHGNERIPRKNERNVK